jgi:putative membrane protein
MTIKPAPACCCLMLTLSFSILHAQGASPADKTFVSKVSQGGAYEVEASRVAEMKAGAQDVKDQAATEVHDHTLVNRELQKVASAKGIQFPTALNATFQQRLDKLKATPADQFDKAYIADMEDIHDGDEKLFAQEAKEGGSPEFKAFAHQTDLIVKRHIGSLHGTDH